MTLTVCGVVDPGFAASACWQPAEKTELTANKMATMIRKLIPTPPIRRTFTKIIF